MGREGWEEGGGRGGGAGLSPFWPSRGHRVPVGEEKAEGTAQLPAYFWQDFSCHFLNVPGGLLCSGRRIWGRRRAVSVGEVWSGASGHFWLYWEMSAEREQGCRRGLGGGLEGCWGAVGL